MSSFRLKVLTIEREFYNDDVDRIIVRTTTGDAGILPKHVPYTAALGIGGLTIIKDGQSRVAAVSGGFVDVSKEQTVVLARTCEWADEIDVKRAEAAADRARQKIQQKESQREHDIAQAKLKKAINRIRIAGGR